MKQKALRAFFLLGIILLNFCAILFISSNNSELGNSISNGVKPQVRTSSVPVTEYIWMDNWDWLGEERGRAMAIDSMDNIIVVGDSELLNGMIIKESCVFVLKYSKHGDLIWNITWGYWNGSWGSPAPNDVIVDSSNNIYIVGEIFSSEGMYTFRNIFIRKYN